MIITGCCRSATTSVANSLRLLHEVQFTPYRDWHNLSELHQKLRGEVSHIAAPFAETLLNDWNVSVVHLIRHPIKVINSLIGIDFWNTNHHRLHRAFIEKFTDIPTNLDPIEKSMEYWYQWNKKLSDLKLTRIRVEDIVNLPRLNGSRRATIPTWDELPNNHNIRILAEQYGYE